MAISASVIFDIRTTGSDTANGGGFDPSVTAGMFSDGAATSANTASPVFTSASYNFVAGDVGAWLYIASGTNWIPGWYQIASVAANAATLSAAVGAAAISLNNTPWHMNTAAGCATVASPTAATWTIDYSQQDTAQFSYTDLASAGAGLTVSSAATPFGRQMVGNMLIVASGTNFTAGNYIIASVSVGLVATVTGAGNITTGVGASGVGGLGGAMATPGKMGERRVTGNRAFLKNGTYTMTSGTSNVAGGRITIAGTATNLIPNALVGWSSERTMTNTGTRPEIDSGAVTAAVMLTVTGNFSIIRNFNLDANSGTNNICLSTTGSAQRYSEIWAKDAGTIGIQLNGTNSTLGYLLRVTNAGGASGFLINASQVGAMLMYCEASGCAGVGFSLAGTGSGIADSCIAFDNVLGGFSSTGSWIHKQCTAYGNTASGFGAADSGGGQVYIGCLSEGNGDMGWTLSSALVTSLINCGGYGNTNGNYSTTQNRFPINFINNTTGTFFTDAANDDFSLNNIANQGALARNAGIVVYPGGTTTTYQDIGAAQHDGSGSGGGVNPFNGLIVSM